MSFYNYSLFTLFLRLAILLLQPAPTVLQLIFTYFYDSFPLPLCPVALILVARCLLNKTATSGLYYTQRPSIMAI